MSEWVILPMHVTKNKCALSPEITTIYQAFVFFDLEFMLSLGHEMLLWYVLTQAVD